MTNRSLKAQSQKHKSISHQVVVERLMIKEIVGFACRQYSIVVYKFDKL